MDYESFLSEYGRHTIHNSLREAARALECEDMIMLAGGVPNPRNFPIETIKMKLRDGSFIEWDEATSTKALQYLPSDGTPDLLEDIKRLIRKYHNPPRFNELKFCVTTGSQDALYKAFQVLINPGDYVIIPNPVYLGVIGTLEPLRAKMLGVSEDENGMCVKELRRMLQEINNPKTIKAMYVNPNSSNPSGTTYSMSRRKELYEVAREFNFLIIEDDAYYFLNFGKERPPSFLSMDTDGRVFRVDSFSKIIAPGFRLGFCSGAPTIVSKVECCIQYSTQQAPAFSQMAVHHILKKWGETGFNRHITRINSFYKNQALMMAESAKRYLTGLAEWHVPDGGMFMWMKILNIQDTSKFTLQTAASTGVLVVPGKVFDPAGHDSPYVRLAFSLAPPDKINEGIKKLAAAIRQHCKVE